MFTRTRKAQDPLQNGQSENDPAYYANSNSASHTNTATHSNPLIIPANNGGKKYDLGEVFDVWYQNKDTILNGTLPIQHGEHYKLAKAKQIYHLDLQSDEKNVKKEDSNGKQHNDAYNDAETQLQNLQLNQEELFDDSFSAPNGARAPPPGMESLPPTDNSVLAASPLVTSDKIQWIYIDPSGNEQGPFNGDMMQDWLTEGYLSFDLKIRRQEELQYNTLHEFCQKVNNFQQPFKVSLPEVEKVPQFLPQQNFNQFNGSNSQDLLFSQQSLHQQLGSSLPGQQPSQQLGSSLNQSLSNQPGPAQSQFQFGNLGRLNNLSLQNNLFGNDFPDPFASNSPLTQNSFGMNQFGNPIQQNIGFNNLQHINPMPSILQHQIQQQQPMASSWGTIDTSNFSNPGTPGPVQQPLAQQPGQPAPISPWTTGIQSQSRVSSPFVATNSNNVNDKEAGNDSVLEDLHSVVTDILSDGDDVQFKKQAKQTKSKQTAPKSVPQQTQQTQQSAPKSVPDLFQQPQPESKPEPESKPQPEPTPATKRKSRQSSMVSEAVAEPQEVKPSTPTLNKLAPWAIPKADSDKPALSLKEIQKMDADRLEKQRQLESQARAEQAAKMWAVEASPTIEKVELPKSTGWATSTSQNITPSKTLAEIQKEEAEAAAAKSKAAKLTSSTASPVTKSSFASALANSVPKEDNSWVTVASKKQPVIKRAATTQPITPIGSKASPQILRSVSAARTPTSSVNGNAVREEFIIWARTALSNLYPSVSKDDLLDMFITLPANNADSSSLISETIYSSSATMDGRRYAQEFMKKRQLVDKQLGASSDVDWSSAILSSADKTNTVDEDGWSTSSKSKKKGKKF